MTITLRPEHERLVSQAMQTVPYQNAEEVIGRALELLRSDEEWLYDNRQWIHDKIERAFEQTVRGEVFSPEESEADMEKRKAAWLADQKH